MPASYSTRGNVKLIFMYVLQESNAKCAEITLREAGKVVEKGGPRVPAAADAAARWKCGRIVGRLAYPSVTTDGEFSGFWVEEI